MYKVRTPDMTYRVLHNLAFAYLLGLTFFSCSTLESHETFCRVLNVLFIPHPPPCHITPLHSLVIFHAVFFSTFNYLFSTPPSSLNLDITLPVQKTTDLSSLALEILLSISPFSSSALTVLVIHCFIHSISTMLVLDMRLLNYELMNFLN